MPAGRNSQRSSEALTITPKLIEKRQYISVMITTRNRPGELRRTLSKLRELNTKADEVLVCADGCTDDTMSVVRNEFPECTLIENATPRGSVFSRDRMLHLAKGDIVISLDDDKAIPSTTTFLRECGNYLPSTRMPR